jgi:ABC-type nitrate/sulfonate/bicarbonate transport system ATPase subunit
MTEIDRSYDEHETLLTVSDVNLTLGKGDRARLILRDVDLVVKNIVRPGMQQGQVKGLLGPSGIGKTQLFRIIAGAQKPDTGSVLVGIDQAPAEPGQVGVVTQHYHVFRHMTVLQNLVFAGMKGGLSRAEAKEKAEYYLRLFDIFAQKDLWPYGQISGGQRQRVAIIQQVLAGHKFICMDEPFSGLDVNQVENVEDLTSKLTREDELLTIIVITHDIAAAIAVSDELWLMGLEHDDATNGFKPGARIVKRMDLIKEGLAWDPDIRHNPRFLETQRLIAENFRTLSPRR